MNSLVSFDVICTVRNEISNIKFLINISTPNVEKISFDDLKKHHNFYIYTKYLAEKILLNHHHPKVKLVSLRIKSPYGYILNTKAVIPSFINSFIKKKKLILTGDINKRQVFTFTEDIGSACLNIFFTISNLVKNSKPMPTTCEP